MIRILLVCLGNICRSPTAHGILQQKINQAGLAGQVVLDSAGTADWHVGKSPDSRAIAAAARNGYDLSMLRGRQVVESDFTDFDLILAMDNSNLHDLLALAPKELAGKVRLFLKYSEADDADEVPDPYYGGDEGFQSVIEMIARTSDNLVARIKDGSL